MPSRSHGAAQFGIRRLDGIRRLNDPAHRDGKGEERNNLFLMAPPTLRDGRIFLAPRPGIKLVERLAASVGVFGPTHKIPHSPRYAHSGELNA